MALVIQLFSYFAEDFFHIIGHVLDCFEVYTREIRLAGRFSMFQLRRHNIA